MNKLSIKKILMLMVIAMVAVTGFAGVAPNFKFDNGESVFASQIADLGLEYKDGSYLIRTEEDYYTMQQRIGDGAGDDVNYKLMNNIEISATTAKTLSQNTVFSGVMDGNGFRVTIRDDAGIKQEEDVKAGDWSGTYDGSATKASSSSTKYWRSNGVADLDSDGVGYDAPYMWVDGLYCDVLNGGTFTNFDISFGKVSMNGVGLDRCTESGEQGGLELFDVSVAVGGLAGAAYNATITNVRVSYGSVSVSVSVQSQIDAGWNGNIYIGGLIGVADNCTIQHCLVQGFSPSVAEYGSASTYQIRDLVVCHTVGLMIGGEIVDVKTNNCAATAADLSTPKPQKLNRIGEENPIGPVNATITIEESFIGNGGITYYPKETTSYGNIDKTDNSGATGTVKYLYNWAKIDGINGGELIQTCFLREIRISFEANLPGGRLPLSTQSDRDPVYPIFRDKFFKVGGVSLGGYTSTDGEYFNRWGLYSDEIDLSTETLNLTYSGYTYHGIYTEKNGGGQKIEKATFQVVEQADEGSPITLYTYWTVNTYTIKYNGNGYTGGSTANSTHIFDQEKALTKNGFTRTGYTFSGWNTVSDGSGDAYTDQQNVKNLTTTNGATINLYAQWTANNYTLTTDAGSGGTIQGTSKQTKTYTVTYDGIYPTLTDATKGHYTFKGWFTAAEGGTQVKAGDTVRTASDHTLYAHWEVIEYTVTYNANGGTISSLNGWSGTVGGSQATKKVDWGADVVGSGESFPALTRTGYTFKGIYKTSVASEQTDDTRVFAQQTLEEWGFTGSCTIYAGWTANTYFLQLNAGTGGIIASTSGYTPTGATQTKTSTTQILTNGQNYTGLLTPTKNYCTFDGWYLNSSFTGNKVTSSTKVDSTADNGATITLYAKWTEIKCTLELDANGGTIASYTEWTGSGTKVTKEMIHGQAYGTLPTSAKISRTGYTLNGWWTTSSGGTQVTSTTTFNAATAEANSGKITIYAHWTPITYTIQYKGNNATSGSTAASIHTYDVGKNLTENGFYRNNYVFTGWNTVSDGSGIAYADKQSVINLTTTDGATINLYAQWTQIYTITLNFKGNLSFNGGDIGGYSLSPQSYGYPTFEDKGSTAEIKYIVGNSFSLPNANNMGERGYTFTGWKRSGQTTIYTQVTSGMAYSFDLDAQWSENIYTVKFYDEDDLKSSITVAYTEEETFPTLDDITTGSNQYRFVGWTATISNSPIPSYDVLDSKYNKSGNIDGSSDAKFEYNGSSWVDDVTEADWYSKIWDDGLEFSKLIHSGTIPFYAVWTPIYTVTIDKNESEATLYGDGKISIDYFHGYTLLPEAAVLSAPNPTVDDTVFWRYHDIKGWVVKVGNTQYYTTSTSECPSNDDWLTTTDPSKNVKTGINLQYLEGNITIVAQWEAFRFEVRFRTDGQENYKDGYNGYTATMVTYDTQYIFVPNGSYNTATKTLVNTTIIQGYSLIYACPYKEGKVQEDKIDKNTQLKMYGTWDYVLDYQKDGSTYYIDVEGYYLGNLYRLNISLNEPYGTPECSATAESFASAPNKIEPLTINTTNWTCGVNDAYNDNVCKLFKDGSNYFIYLLQDSQITYDTAINRSIANYSQYEYNYDTNVHTYTSCAYTLPTWTIPYYEMQYYYIAEKNTPTDIHMYQMAEVETAHTEIAKAKISVGANYKYPLDWSYTYCDKNNDDGVGYTLNLYWYRKRINIEVSNLFNGANSTNGYTVVYEDEQITGTLQDHSPYHVVIYINDGESNKYYTRAYSGVPTTSIVNDLPFDADGNIITADLRAKGWTATQSIEIYFGNSFTLMARDQSKDHSLNDFIGYRFKTFTLDEIFATPVLSGYRATQNLQEIDEDTPQSGVTQYIQDRATYLVTTNFEKMGYTITYQISNETLTYTSKYGNIRLQGKDCDDNTINSTSSSNQSVTLQINDSMKSTMNVRLGTELLYWRSSTKDIVLTDNQVYTLQLTPEFISTHIYNGAGTYSVDNGTLTIHAVCQDIAFDINVNVKDKETGEIIRTYTLGDVDGTDTALGTDLLFTLEGGKTQVSIDNEYIIKMLSKKTGDEYLYYHQGDTQYAILRLYIDHSASHSTEQLVTTFDYPTTSIDVITMNVNNSLLDYTINYTQFVEVKDVNRYLDFYIEVSPTIEISFSNYISDANDAKIGVRELTVMGQKVVSSDSDGDGNGDGNLVILGSYLGYVGQTVTFNATADSRYYKGVRLWASPAYESVNMMLGANTSYKLTRTSTIYVTFSPKTYTYTTKYQYNGSEYASWEDIKLADGTAILSIASIEESADNREGSPGYCYYGEALDITAKLSTEVTGFELNVYKNGVKLTGNSGKYIATFTGENITILIDVTPQPENVVITTNYPDKDVADIHVKVNNGDIKPLTEYTAGIDLIDGDGLTVYVKSKLGYNFNNQHTKDDITTNLTVTDSEDMPEYVEFQLFTSYQALGVKNAQGTYFLQFNEVPIVAEFVYYSIVDNGEVLAGQGYATSKTSYMPEEEVEITKGTDNEGYRFLGYTYANAMGQEGAVDLDSTFTIAEDIYEYLSIGYPDSISEGKLSFKIYINYINQYKITKDPNNSSKSKIELTNAEGNSLYLNTYYDHGTEVTMKILSSDTTHYQLLANIGGADITKDTEGITDILTTNKDNLSGFTKVHELIANTEIRLTIIAEKYYTKLQEHIEYYDRTEEQSSSLQGITTLSLTGGIDYIVETSHEYNSLVTIKIYTAVPVNTGEAYYKLEKIELNSNMVDVGEGETVEIEGVEYMEYTLSYELDEDQPIEPILDIYYKAYYQVEIVFDIT